MVLSALIAMLSPELVIIPEQVRARTRPTFYDLLIALAAGSAGAYTIARKESGAFVRGQIWLFFLLTAAVCIPLWSYSEKILFNAQYRASKSDILQTWLSENQLELTDVDIYRESMVLVLGLAGPNPPVNLEKLYQQLSGSEHFGKFTIEYAWTQKVTGVWQATQYDINTTALPRQSDSYSLSFDDRGKFRVIAACGNLKGSYSFSGRSLNINFNRNWLSGCRRDDILKLFTDDLTRAGSEGIMRFESTP